MSASAAAAARFAFAPGEREQLEQHVDAQRQRLARLVIAIDGPAGSGKSTTARAVAERLGLRHLDTGAMYRALTLAALRDGTPLDDGAALAALARSCGIRVEIGAAGMRVLLGATDVSEQVRAPEIGAHVSQVAAHPEVRCEMVERQRRLARRGGTIMDGRDIGTVVLPHADVKVFLTADVDARAGRRRAEESARGTDRPLQEIASEIQARDHVDSTRASAPLSVAADATVIDTSEMDIATQVDAVLALAVRRVQPGENADALGFVDPEAWAQPGYRRYHHVRFRIAQALTGAFFRLAYGARRRVHPAALLRGSVLVACNHISLLDPPVVGTSLPFETSFVAKEELFRSRWLGGLVRALNAYPIRRGTADFSALDRAVADLRQGRSVMMFPEGTRQRPGHLAPARWGFGYVAARAGRPVVPAFVRGTTDLRARGLRRQPMEVWVGEPVDVSGIAGATAREQYDRIGALVMARVEALMLRSAGRTPLPGLEIAAYAEVPTVPVRRA